jgi:DNA polymerase-1
VSDRVVLVDGSALVYRAFFALPPHLTTKDGIHTNAVFGFATMFKKLFAGKRPTFGAVIFDPPGKTTRDEKYPAYKAQRSPMPDDLIEQLALIDRVVKAYNFPMLRVPGLEADDVIGTLAHHALDAGHEVVIVSSDKDFAQLVCERLWMQDTIKDVIYDRDLVKKKWGVFPEQMVDYLALVGDASDNIPGVEGIGNKGAVQLLEEHGSLEKLLGMLGSDPPSLKPRYEKLLEAGKHSALLSQDLATIDRHAKLPVDVEGLAVPLPETAELNALFTSLEFYSLLSREQTAAARAEGAVGGELVVCATPDDVAAALPSLEGTVAIAPMVDGRYVNGPLVGLSLSAKPRHVVYVPLSPAGDDARLRALVPLLQDPAHDKVLHDAKETFVALKRRGVTLRGVTFDTRLASFLVDPNKLIIQHHSIDAVTKEYLHRTLPAKKELVGAGKSEQQLKDIEVARVAAHAAELVHAVRDLAPLLADLLKERGQQKYLDEVELPLSWVLGRMEIDGIAVDAEELKSVGVELAGRLASLEKTIHAHAGKEFNVGSPKQLGEILFEVLKLPVIKRTKSGYSTDAEVLERLASKHDICKELLEYRRIDKLINTYTDVLQREVSDGRVHCCFQQTVGVTGRLITMDPDLQRTPTKTHDGKRIRDAFVAMPLSDGTPTVIVDADWSQIELRLLAHASRDPALVDAYVNGRDIHKKTAAQVLGKREEDVTKKEREVGKLVNFSTIYGQGAIALAQIIGVKKSEADEYIARYFELYAGVRRWLDETVALADERGWAETLLGRKRIIPELHSRSPMDRGFGERVAANTPIQGSAADICKLAMLHIAKELPHVAPRSRMVLQVHDELLFECPVDEGDNVMKLAKDKMEHVVALAVPLVAEVGVGRSWGEAK